VEGRKKGEEERDEGRRRGLKVEGGGGGGGKARRSGRGKAGEKYYTRRVLAIKAQENRPDILMGDILVNVVWLMDQFAKPCTKRIGKKRSATGPGLWHFRKDV